MVGCDVCDGWFHIACLARAPGFELDGLSHEDTEFVCPPCVAVFHTFKMPGYETSECSLGLGETRACLSGKIRY
jgi:hypothetical protein